MYNFINSQNSEIIQKFQFYFLRKYVINEIFKNESSENIGMFLNFETHF
jgi:hypothetical protein